MDLKGRSSQALFWNLCSSLDQSPETPDRAFAPAVKWTRPRMFLSTSHIRPRRVSARCVGRGGKPCLTRSASVASIGLKSAAGVGNMARIMVFPNLGLNNSKALECQLTCRFLQGCEFVHDALPKNSSLCQISSKILCQITQSDKRQISPSKFSPS
jgi:hypothetical protein